MEQLFVWDRVLLNLRYKLTNGGLGKKTVIVDPTLFRRIILSKLIPSIPIGIRDTPKKSRSQSTRRTSSPFSDGRPNLIIAYFLLKFMMIVNKVSDPLSPSCFLLIEHG